MRGPERKGEAFICRYSWIPHQVRNDREGISGFRVAPSHPAQRCGVQWRVFPGYRVVARYDVKYRVVARYDVKLRVVARYDVKLRVVARYDVVHRIKCGMT